MTGVGVILAGIAQAHDEPVFICLSNHIMRLSGQCLYLTYYTYDTITFTPNATGIFTAFPEIPGTYLCKLRKCLQKEDQTSAIMKTKRKVCLWEWPNEFDSNRRGVIFRIAGGIILLDKLEFGELMVIIFLL